jgi:hypothetical protein
MSRLKGKENQMYSLSKVQVYAFPHLGSHYAVIKPFRESHRGGPVSQHLVNPPY